MAAASPPSRLLRSRSGAPTGMSMMFSPETSRCSSQRYSIRSKSTTKSRNTTSKGDRENYAMSSFISSVPRLQRKPQDCNRDTAAATKIPQHGNLRGPSVASRKVRSAPPSPSAWMSTPPGRTSMEAQTTSTSSSFRAKSDGGGSISRVLKYFRTQKKVSPAQEEEFHKLRMLQNRLLQWRFANAKAETRMTGTTRTAEEKLFRVWVRISKLRCSVAEKRMEMQRLMDGIKLYDILSPQIYHLNEWGELERKYNEGVSRMIRKLSAFSNNVPLLQGAQADLVALDEAVRLAMEVMDNIDRMCAKFSDKAENLHLQLIQASDILRQRRECAQELEIIFPGTLDLLLPIESLQFGAGKKESNACAATCPGGWLVVVGVLEGNKQPH
ncbi:QWRF motif-containing protein 7 [Punica granatum]|uniref:QWRF motif-containing protein 7 n=1 Tax=Punica granatum TaxID=22663 RepID=A0A6P8CAR4_PUNGR|nr:QWRF motif-containing protein 7 [Punica granatum]